MTSGQGAGERGSEYRIRHRRTFGIEQGISNYEVKVVRNIAPYMLFTIEKATK